MPNARARAMVWKRTCDERNGTRDHEGRPDALHDPRRQEQRAAGRQATGDGSHEKHGIAGQHGAPTTEAIGKRA